MSNLAKIPKYSDIVSKTEQDYHNDELNLLLNTEPPAEWRKTHPYIRNHTYLPIDKIEYLLRVIFGQYKIEITGQGSSFNGVWVTVRVHYLNPVTKEWMFHDGIGSIELQVKKGHSASDLANINNGALSMAYPIAKTLAIKDACDMFGKLFGADLNRNNTVDYLKIENPIDAETVDSIYLSILKETNILTARQKANKNKLIFSKEQADEIRKHINALSNV